MITIICILLTVLLFYIDNKKNEERARESNLKTSEKARQQLEQEQRTREFMIRHKEARDRFAKLNGGPDEFRFQYHTPGEIKDFKEQEENEKIEGYLLTDEEQEELFAEMRRMSMLKRENLTEYNKIKNIKTR